ncbi:stalk domain-containing protein [Paenibacillus terrigena]|uniref:stalk domain-containing protein n=1 Tax=Paenibacillus terrigena TaxID=369333 RepID=UPI00035F9565|nr:stalk domain-containing protein [Paenibacillus terrigena]
MIRRFKTSKAAFTLLISLILLFGIVSVTSASSTDFIKAKISNIKIMVNNKSRNIKANMLNVNGVNYVPLKEFANILGYTTDYKNSTKTIEINKKEGEEDSLVIDDNGNILSLDEWVTIRELSLRFGVKIKYEDSNVVLTYKEKTINLRPSNGANDDIPNLIAETTYSSEGIPLLFVKGVMYLKKSDAELFIEQKL